MQGKPVILARVTDSEECQHPLPTSQLASIIDLGFG